MGRLTSATIPTQGTTTYTYDANGNRLTKVNGGTTTTYTYDDADQLTLEGTTSSTYDAAGNMTAKGTSTYAYDWRGRMTSSTVSGTTTTFTYDGTDTRVKKQTGATTTTYLWDRESGLPLLIDDGTNGYVHQGTGNPRTQTTLAGGTPKWLLTDALGSVRGAADAAGTLTGSANYDAFGAPYGTDSTGSKLGFTGEQRDAETGFEYLRARYYNPSNGRFTSRDSLFPSSDTTQGYNRYSYADNNPTTATDPSGQATVAPTIPKGIAVLAMAARIIGGGYIIGNVCLQGPSWCVAGLSLSLAAVLVTDNSIKQWGGMVGVAAAIVACGMDLEIVDADGPPGVFSGSDIGHCFKTFARVASNIADCTNRPAYRCLPALPRIYINFAQIAAGAAAGAVTAVANALWNRCFPEGLDGDHKVYFGFDRETGEFTYIGRTSLPLAVRERLHNTSPSHPRNIRLVQVVGGLSRRMARAIEQLLLTEYTLRGYNLTNEDDAVDMEIECWPLLIAEGSKVLPGILLRAELILWFQGAHQIERRRRCRKYRHRRPLARRGRSQRQPGESTSIIR